MIQSSEWQGRWLVGSVSGSRKKESNGGVRGWWRRHACPMQRAFVYRACIVWE